MQSVSATCIQSPTPKAIHTAAQTAGGSAEPVPETPSSSRGIRNGPARRPSANDTQFTAFLQNGTALNTFSPEELCALQMTGNEEENKKTGQDGLLDISSLLIQLTLSGAPAQAQNVVEGDVSETSNAAISGLSGVLAVSAEAADGIALAGETTAAIGLQQNGETVEAVLSNIADSIAAMKNEQSADVIDGQSGASPAGISADIATALSHDLNDTAESAESKTPVSALIKDGSENAASGLTAGKRIAGTDPAEGGSQSKSRFGAFNPQNKNEDNDTGTAVNVLQQAVADPKLNGETSAEKTAAVEKALNRFVDDLKSIKGGSQEIKIVLEPESLGVLTISVLKTENGISAKIRSEDKEVAAAITDQLQKLISSMQNNGINVKEVDVAYSQTEQNMSFLRHDFSQSREDTSNGYTTPRNRNTEPEAPDSDPWKGYYGGTSGDTTVDYRI